jgi:hypothetical protein
VTAWFRVAFEHALVHCVSSELMASFLYEMAIHGHPIEDYARTYGRAAAATLGGNPRIVGEWALDLGSNLFANEPTETFDVEGLVVSLACRQFSHVLRVLERLPLRTFDRDTPYYEIKLWLHATILTPSQRDVVLRVLTDQARVADARVRAFAASLRLADATQNMEVLS